MMTRWRTLYLVKGKVPIKTLGLSLGLAALLLMLGGLLLSGGSSPAPLHAARPLSTYVSDDIVADTTWTLAGSPYILLNSITVRPGVTLTIEPGVVVQGPQDAELRVQGHLEAVGTTTQPIIFTSVDNTNGWQWKGLVFDGGTGNLRYATVRYAGRPNSTGFASGITIRDVLTGQVLLEDCHVHKNWRWDPWGLPDYGVVITNSHATIRNTLFTENGNEATKDAPLYIVGAASTVTLTNNTFTANIPNRIWLAPDAMIGHDFALPAQAGLEAYYLSADFVIPPTVTLTIEPGVTLMAPQDAELRVLGHLEAVGTATQPIIFTSVDNTNGWQWKGLVFDGGTGNLRYATVRYAGRPNSTGFASGITIRDVLTGQVLLEDCHVHKNWRWDPWGLPDYGVVITNSHATIRNTLFTENGNEATKDAPLYIVGAASTVTLTNNTFTGNIRNRIVLAPDAMMSHDVTLTRQAVLDAYQFESGFTVPPGVTLTLEPGVTVKEDATDIRVQGHLEAVGTATQPITFTSVTDTGPGWDGLLFDGGTGNLRHVTVRYGARLWNRVGIRAGLMARNVLTGEVRLENCQVRNNYSTAWGNDYGLYVENSRLTIQDTLFTGNGNELDYTYNYKDAPLYITGASSVVTLTHNTFTGNIRDRVVLAPGAMMSHDVTLTRQAALQAYELDGFFTVPPTVTLTIEPGLTVNGHWDTELKVQGHLEAVGTATQPITFTSVTNTGPNQWNGLLFDGGTGNLRHVTVRYAGRVNTVGFSAGITARNVLTGQVRLESSQVRNCSWWHGSADYGMVVLNSRAVVSHTLFTGITGGGGDAPLYIVGAASVVTLTHNTFTGNLRDRVVLAPGAMMSHDVTLTRQATLQAYELEGTFAVPLTVTLTVEPGVMLMSPNELRVQGHLEAVGTATQPITFTSVTNTGPNQWNGLLFDGGTGNLRHVTVRYAGGANTAGFRAGITARNVLTGQVRLESSQVRNCWWWHGAPDYGMAVADSRVVVSDTLFTGIGNGGGDAALYVTGAGSTVILQNDTILDNREYGIHLTSGGQVTMTQVSLVRNGSHGVLVDGDASMLRMTRSTVMLSGGDGVRNTGAARVVLGGAPGAGNGIMGNTGLGANQVGVGGVMTATYNWWGDPTGPYHPTLNPSGKGNRVSDRVLFDPWATDWSGDTVRVLQVQVIGPQRASPGATVDYAVSYLSTLTYTVQSAVLVMDLPTSAFYLESTADGIYWRERHQVFWKLGNLAPGQFGTVSARIRYQWGLPLHSLETALASLGGANLDPSPVNVQEYLDYEPITIVQSTELTPEQFAQERQALSDLDILYNRLLASGFVTGTFSSLAISTGNTVTQSVLLKPDLSALAYVSRQANGALVMTVDHTSVALADATGGITLNLQTGAYEQWESSSQQHVAAVWPAISMRNCLLNCLILEAGSSLMSEFIKVVDAMQTIDSCVQFLADPTDPEASAACIAGIQQKVPGADTAVTAVNCYIRYTADPNFCICKADKWESGKMFWQEICRKVPCINGIYQTHAREGYFCAFNEKCEPGLDGSSDPWDHCKKCPESSPKECQPPRSASSHSGACWLSAAADQKPASPPGCQPTCILLPHDPNAKYGPEGDLLPGQWVTYTVTYENEGEGRAYGVYITDRLSEHFDAATLTIRGNGRYIPSTRTIIWFVGELGPKGEPDSKGDVSFTVRLKSNLPGGTPIINWATVYFPSVPEETATNAVVNIIQPVVAVPKSVETNYMQPVSIALQGRDVGNASLTFAIASPPLHGALSQVGDTAIYTPMANFVGMDYFSYQASNGIIHSRPAEVQITVRPEGDTTPPEVLRTWPKADAVDVTPAATPIYSDAVGPLFPPFPIIQFSEPVDAATVTAETIQMVAEGGVPVPIRVDYDATVRRATVALRQPLQPVTWYTITVKTGVRDLAGNALAHDYTWSFRTAAIQYKVYLPLVLRKY